jgi:hypothetical protein
MIARPANAMDSELREDCVLLFSRLLAGAGAPQPELETPFE